MRGSARLGMVAAALFVAASLPGVGLAAGKPAADGKPRLAGIWEMQGYRSSRQFTARQRIGLDVDGRPPPLQPWAQQLLDQRIREADDDNRIFANNAARCLPQGMPYMLFAAVDGPIQIIEDDDQVTILSTEMSEHLLIHLNAQHPRELDPNYHGDSVGHWEGDTLVVDTVGISGEKTTVDQVGTPHSDELHLVTRFRRTGPDDLEIRMKLEDPKAFTRAWERRVTYRRGPPGLRVEEYVCENLRNAPDPSGYQSFRRP